jgi:NADH:ubiquinone reductase (H+-translocating)
MSATEAGRGPKPESSPRVLILGGGFAGIGAARKLRKADVDVVLVDGHDYHTFQPRYTLADAVRLKGHILERWEAADKDPSLIEDGALNVVIVGGRPTGVEGAGAIAELYRALFVKDYPDIPQEKAILLIEAGPEIFTMFKPNVRAYAKKAFGGRDVQVQVGGVVESVMPTGVTLKSGRVIPAHTLVWGAGLQATRSSGCSAWSCRGGTGSRKDRISASRAIRRCSRSGISPWSLTPRQTRSCLSSDRSRSSPGTTRARTLPGSSKTRKPSRSNTSTRGTMATIGRGAAVMQGPHGRTMKGKAASLAWGSVHLAVLSTGEDRAQAMIDWSWAGFTHD